jgi:hypothetical protein
MQIFCCEDQVVKSFKKEAPHTKWTEVHNLSPHICDTQLMKEKVLSAMGTVLGLVKESVLSAMGSILRPLT